MHVIRTAILLSFILITSRQNAIAQPPNRDAVMATMKTAASYLVDHVASHGGYVYHYSEDLQQRWGEGVATVDQAWVQPPGTPTVGMAFLKAYAATGDELYLSAAQAAAEALVYGQMKSGGWTNCIDFNPRGDRVAMYRNGQGRGRDTSSLDDGQTASALKMLILTDKALKFQHAEIHAAAISGLDALLDAQYPNGAFPQVWDETPEHVPPNISPKLTAGFPDYDWATEGRIKNYWDMYTLNDNVPGYVTDTLIAAFETYQDQKVKDAVLRLGDFLLLAQMPEPQPGWAQQYGYEMHPIWARKFEPPAVSGDETQEVLSTLLIIAEFTDNKKYLAPFPAALKYLRRSQLADGRFARYYELRTNAPLYMERSGDKYVLTHDDSNLPDHYGWKTDSQIDQLTNAYQSAIGDAASTVKTSEAKRSKQLATNVQQAISELDNAGRWISVSSGERLVGQLKLPAGTRYLSSAVFSERLELLSEYLDSLE